MMGPSAIGAQPPPEDYDEEWLMMQEDEEGDEPFCTCSTGHGIEETDWNQCDSCGKPIYDEEPAVPPSPTFRADEISAGDLIFDDPTHNAKVEADGAGIIAPVAPRTMG